MQVSQFKQGPAGLLLSPRGKTTGKQIHLDMSLDHCSLIMKGESLKKFKIKTGLHCLAPKSKTNNNIIMYIDDVLIMKLTVMNIVMLLVLAHCLSHHINARSLKSCRCQTKHESGKYIHTIIHAVVVHELFSTCT